MKILNFSRLLFLVFFISIGFVSNAQVDRIEIVEISDDDAEKVYTYVDENPSFPGGETALYKYLADSIVYPTLARDNGISGIVYLSFVVEKDGSVGNVKLLRDIGGGCGAEAVRVVKAMPKWKPGIIKGKPVRALFNLPISFSF